MHLAYLRIYISWCRNSPHGWGEPEQEPDSVNNRLLSVSFSLAHIYLFGMMKGNSTLIVKTNTISTNTAYVNTAVGVWWMNCNQCQHLFLRRRCDTQPQWSMELKPPSAHPPIIMVYMALEAFSPLLVSSLMASTLSCSFITSQFALSYA